MKNEYYNWPWEPMDTIPVDNKLNTLLRLNPEFPLAISHDNLSFYKNSFINWHKQGSIEIAIVTEGAITLNLLNRQEKIYAGEGFIILPGILHSIRGHESIPSAKYETMFFEPSLITCFRGSYFEKHYYKPEIISKNSFFRFSIKDDALQTLTSDFNLTFQDTYWGNPYLENQIQQTLQRLWITLWEHVIIAGHNDAGKADDDRLLKIIDFLQKNHQNKFILDELCDYVNLSRSACCRYFKKMMMMSISDYLLEYRLSQALFMLHNTDKTITEIAIQSGFSTTSYFISQFKNKMSMTPFEYRSKK